MSLELAIAIAFALGYYLHDSLKTIEKTGGTIFKNAWKEYIKQRKFQKCEKAGHDWIPYVVSTGYGSNDIEQAGYCSYCGYDTHEGYEQEESK